MMFPNRSSSGKVNRKVIRLCRRIKAHAPFLKVEVNLSDMVPMGQIAPQGELSDIGRPINQRSAFTLGK